MHGGQVFCGGAGCNEAEAKRGGGDCLLKSIYGRFSWCFKFANGLVSGWHYISYHFSKGYQRPLNEGSIN
jgi:hypothetical protein